METADVVIVGRDALNEMEQRAVLVNGALLRMYHAIQRGDLEAIANCRSLAQELNWTNRRSLIEAGAVDSIAAERSPSSSTVWDEDEPPVDAEQLDLGALSSLPMDAPEGQE